MGDTIKPFRATHYNPGLFNDYSKLVCPPYDVISKGQLNRLRKKSPYNFSHILIADKKNYKKAGKKFSEWVDKNILVDDNVAGFYFYEQHFKIDGRRLSRFGILCLLSMDERSIFPHENTFKGPKIDRKRILQTLKANLSPIFVISAKRIDFLKDIRTKLMRKEPLIKFCDDEGNLNRAWNINETADIKKICRGFERGKLVIADGHHRFEISYDYFLKNKSRFKDLNWILAYVTGYQQGLVILPTHRVAQVKNENEFFKKLKEVFGVFSVSRRKLEEKLKEKGDFRMGIYRRGKFYLLKLKDKGLLKQVDNPVYRKLDSYVFQKAVLPLFAIKGDIEYTHSIKEAKKISGDKKTAFLLRAVSLEEVVKVSSKGLKLPQKSTYFYPKILSGIVLRRFKP
ncbi:MAG: DUF1015 family protein [Candidatus Omnitrophica bacterium]|nr:DUF1015 family protein [Candidatus Omnitrophota bacterium]MBD3269640.1 DUF1015 family protein [Candidatus Omnitrophota bacterium]